MADQSAMILQALGFPATMLPGEIDVVQPKGAQEIHDISSHDALRDKFFHAMQLTRDLDYLDALRIYNVIDQTEANYLRRYWFPSPIPPAAKKQAGQQGANKQKGPRWAPWVWWQEHQPIVDIVREGMIQAFGYSKMTKLPVDYYWVIAKSGTPRVGETQAPKQLPVRMHAIPDNDRINLFQVTPAPPATIIY